MSNMAAEIQEKIQALPCELHSEGKQCDRDGWQCANCQLRYLAERAAAEEERLCRGCDHFKEYDSACKRLDFTPDDWEPQSVSIYAREQPGDDPHGTYVTIADPDDFACNKWIPKESEDTDP